MNNIIYIDCKFIDMLSPELLSLGMVSSHGDEHYVELDLDGPASAPTLARASDFVRHNGGLSQWGRVPGSAATREQMGVRTARWVLEQVARFGQPALIAYDHTPGYRLFELLLRDTGQWDTVRDQVRPGDIDDLTSRFDAMLGAVHAYECALRRGLERGHALADAHALRARCIAALTGKRVRL